MDILTTRSSIVLDDLNDLIIFILHSIMSINDIFIILPALVRYLKQIQICFLYLNCLNFNLINTSSLPLLYNFSQTLPFKTMSQQSS